MVTNKPVAHFGGRPASIWLAMVACLILPGCGAIAVSGASEETAYLDREVIPQIIKWRAGTESFSFARFAKLRNYEKICLLGQYGSLDMIGREVEPLDSYYSTFGAYVPENFIAVVAIRNRTAHAALLELGTFDIGIVPAKRCGNAEKTVLRRVAPEHEWSSPSALLEPVL
ncbi:MAG TPA: hypothetical protein VE891_16125 [Allosphingosinicella sp.]|nr:hypothetical protein [Allosphingosinicella sp.]